jgi:hypothetical protein
MSVLPRGPVAGLLAAMGLLAAGCATARTSTETLTDGTKHVRCRLSLPDCLVEVERLCQGRHYAVLRAVDEHDPRGGPELNTDVRTSEALVRCGPAIGWPAGVDPMAQPPAPIPPSPPASPRACVPGVTQACVGPGGCGGGQACSADGTGFGACDCGGDANGVRGTR